MLKEHGIVKKCYACIFAEDEKVCRLGMREVMKKLRKLIGHKFVNVDKK